jgi:hypothetical protein
MVGVRAAYLAALLAVTVLLEACAGGGVPREERAAWRDKAEAQCMASGAVRASSYVQSASPINGPSACGIRAPLKVSGALGGRVKVKPTATLGCPVTAHLDRWLNNSVQKAAYRQFGKPVVEIRQISSDIAAAAATAAIGGRCPSTLTAMRSTSPPSAYRTAPRSPWSRAGGAAAGGRRPS